MKYIKQLYIKGKKFHVSTIDELCNFCSRNEICYDITDNLRAYKLCHHAYIILSMILKLIILTIIQIRLALKCAVLK